ncbi:AraC family transcriptional regulator [Paenibacillus timonensis]|uniref:Helix-turn-helix domain-containing protein n=1 Tax=Paenibacillus timonensis TaxID=225915 RepID=A0ABW3SDE3_9BACL|nr:AraC family transcriptional regulator [Paenibacillus timonensis]MCH1641187.1 AraC family transcriptional regulator [Paenibacillus timonensis]GJM79495.1 AraC family transcriptional regulator [Paenibacillus sp. HMSSN-139]
MNTDRITIPPGFWVGLQLLEIDPFEVARQARLTLTRLTDPVAVTTAQYFRIWQTYADLMGDTAKAVVKLAATFESDLYPPTVLATYHARNYRDALYGMARYKPMCPPETLLVNETGSHCTLELKGGASELTGPPVLIGTTMAFLLELGRRGTGQPIKARSVEFSGSVGDVKALEAYFGCRVTTGSNGNRLMLDRRDLDRPFVSYNQELLEILSPVLDRSLDEKRSRSIAEAVCRTLKRGLGEGRLDIRFVAKELGMSDRTLQRRLADEGTTFKQLLNQARHEQARAYLANPELNIKEVAFLVGYEDQNSFYRAFRLWEGDTPSNWRSALLGRRPS